MSGRRTLVWVLMLMFVGAAWHPASAQPNPAVPDSIDQRLKACSACHGDKGEGLATKNEY